MKRKYIVRGIYAIVLIAAIIVTACITRSKTIEQTAVDTNYETAKTLLKTYGWEIAPETDDCRTFIAKDCGVDAARQRYSYMTAPDNIGRRYNLTNSEFDLFEVYIDDNRIGEAYQNAEVDYYRFNLSKKSPVEMTADFCFFDGVLGVAQICTDLSGVLDDDLINSPDWDNKPPVCWPLDVSREEFDSDMQKWEEFLSSAE